MLRASELLLPCSICLASRYCRSTARLSGLTHAFCNHSPSCISSPAARARSSCSLRARKFLHKSIDLAPQMEISKNLVAALNLITLALSIPILGAGIWLASQHHSDCVQFLQGPVITIGLFMLIVSVAGFVGAYLRITWLLWVYLLVMFLLIVLLFCFTVFSFAVTNKGAGEALSGKGYKDYRLGDYSTWLQKRVRNEHNWRKIKSCISDAHVCESLKVYKLAADFYEAELSSVQSGCCKPPTACNFLFLNATYWGRPLNEDADPDCHRYSYVQSELCYDCDSCKAGIVDKVRHDWRKVATVNIVIFFLVIIVYSVGCHSFHRAQEQGTYTRYGKGII